MVYLWALIWGVFLYFAAAFVAGKFIKKLLEWDMIILVAILYLVLVLFLLHYLFVDDGYSSEYITKIALASAVGLVFGLRSRIFRWRF
ncbi:MAG: hypothetical protein R3211_10075 [Balneolaceae bacterium]|nr:hypothetical protein [Balneolaceae bacterium]